MLGPRPGGRYRHGNHPGIEAPEECLDELERRTMDEQDSRPWSVRFAQRACNRDCPSIELRVVERFDITVRVMNECIAELQRRIAGTTAQQFDECVRSCVTEHRGFV
jgi:hypothetical protein